MTLKLMIFMKAKKHQFMITGSYMILESAEDEVVNLASSPESPQYQDPLLPDAVLVAIPDPLSAILPITYLPSAGKP